MTKIVFDRIMEGLREARAVARGEADPYAVHPITAERHRGAPAKIGDDNASQAKAPEVG